LIFLFTAPAEVLDALLMAFPALGLAKIIWAVDIILAMDIPDFRIDALAQAGQWQDLMASADIASGETMRIECDGRDLFIHRNKKTYQVYDSRCPHQRTDIPHLALQGNTLTCPKHQWAFDVASGDCIAKGNTGLTRFESRLLKGRLQTFW